MSYYPQYYNPQQYVPQQQQQMINQFVWVQGESSARAYLVPPGGEAYLMDTDSPTLFYKTCDSAGRPTMKTYELVEKVEADPVVVTPENSVQAEEMPNYLTRDDLNDMGLLTKDDMNNILHQLQQLKDDILDIQTTPNTDSTRGRKATTK